MSPSTNSILLKQLSHNLVASMFCDQSKWSCHIPIPDAHSNTPSSNLSLLPVSVPGNCVSSVVRSIGCGIEAMNIPTSMHDSRLFRETVTYDKEWQTHKHKTQNTTITEQQQTSSGQSIDIKHESNNESRRLKWTTQSVDENGMILPSSTPYTNQTFETGKRFLQSSLPYQMQHE